MAGVEEEDRSLHFSTGYAPSVKAFKIIGLAEKYQTRVRRSKVSLVRAILSEIELSKTAHTLDTILSDVDLFELFCAFAMSRLPNVVLFALIDAGLDVYVDRYTYPSPPYTPVCPLSACAFSVCRSDLFFRLLERGANPNAEMGPRKSEYDLSSTKSDPSYSVLWYMLDKSAYEECLMLLQKGAVIEPQDRKVYASSKRTFTSEQREVLDAYFTKSTNVEKCTCCPI